MKKVFYGLMAAGALLSSQVFACDYYIGDTCHYYSGYENYYAN